MPDDNVTITPLYGWAADYDLDSYPGTVYNDGVTAAVTIVTSSPDVVTLLAIAPATNFPSMIEQGGPKFVANARVVAMSGSIRRGCTQRPQVLPTGAACALFSLGCDCECVPR